MSELSHSANSKPPAITDSPWFWVMLFSTASLVALALIAPKYSMRQRQLEMQYQAREETLRRNVESDHPADDAPTIAPPAPGDLIIPLGPLFGVCAVLLLVSMVLLKRDARRAGRIPAPGDSGEP